MAFKTGGGSAVGYYSKQQGGLSSPQSVAIQDHKSSTPDFFEIEAAEVLDVILDDSHKYNSGNDYHPEKIGQIEFRFLYSDNNVDGNWAKPLISNNRKFPIKGEIVLISKQPVFNSYDSTDFKDYYYSDTLNVWGSVHQNSLPDLSKNRDNIINNNGAVYSKTISTGVLNKTTREHTFGDTFKEKDDIVPLRIFEGDVTIEGRWGQSIRFGSIAKTTSNPNKYSLFGNTGDPIIIIRNGIGSNSINKRFYIEDINKDECSIYLTKGQTIDLKLSGTKRKTYKQSFPKKFDGNQIIINSDRLIFNSKGSDLILAAKGNLGVLSDQNIHINSTQEMIVDALRTRLGVDATEPMVLGRKLVDLLAEMVQVLLTHTHLTGPSPGAPTTPSIDATPTLNKILTTLKLPDPTNTLLSNIAFIKKQ